ncbi:ABC transporter substrate-binding protein [Palleronia sediminis]|uniref:ABC transporter substrate-binding protein n=1 Tax=Palleronia sediminis TaxID=2547833 RepID=A0A4R6ADM0_9RHOB|nr:ABC transporter substrate-binding protein [Palleronia sediminis]TDL81195.1 ABC transporter substrate-binding protein [Palleronia sediminis]
MNVSKIRIALAATLVAGATPLAAQELLRVPVTYDITSFDPDNSFEALGLGAIHSVYEGLVEYSPGTTEITGLLATRWTISEDGLTYTFDLTDNVSFHDGTPMDANAVLAALKRRQGDDMMLSYFLWNVTEMSAPDADTVVLTLGQPQPSLLDQLASPWGPKITSPVAFAENAADDNSASWATENAVGTGPYVLERFARGQDYLLVRFNDYHGTAPYFDRIEIPVIPDIGQQILQLRSGEIDAVPTNYPWAQLAALAPGLEITANESMALILAFVKPGSMIAEDAAVREAVLTAIAPQTWIVDAFAGYATAAKSLFQAAMLTPDNPVVFPTDMEAARAAIEAQGPVSVTLGYGVEETENVGRVADLLSAQLSSIGVESEVNVLPAGALFVLQGAMETAPDLLVSRANPDSAHPENQAAVFYQTGAVLNLMGASLPEADEIAKGAASMTDIAERDAAFARAGEMWVEAGKFIPLVDVQDVVVHAEGLTDLGLRPVFPPGNIDFGMVRWAD